MTGSIRDEIARMVDDAVPGDVPGYRHRYGLAAADAIIAHFPHITADHTLYQFAASLRTQLLAATAETETLRDALQQLSEQADENAHPTVRETA